MKLLLLQQQINTEAIIPTITVKKLYSCRLTLKGLELKLTFQKRVKTLFWIKQLVEENYEESVLV